MKRSILEGYLPGCYRNVPCETDESLAGYLARLAEANGYGGIHALLRAAEVRYSGPVRNQILKLFTDRRQLARISRMAVGNPQHLERFACEALPDPARTPARISLEALFRHARRVDVDALLPIRAPVCPRCLGDSGYVREEWELAPVTVCAIHGCLLIDQCTECHATLRWERSQIAFCGECHVDLRTFRTELASDVVREVSLDFQSLAPFRVVDSGGRTHVVDWDEMFRTFKALLLPNWTWAERKFPALHVAQTTIVSRHELIERFAGAWSNGRYDISRLQWKVRRALAPLRATCLGNALNEVATHFLEADVGLSRDLAVSLSGLENHDTPKTAVQVFNGSPPVISNTQELARILNSTNTEIAHLIALNLIRPKLFPDMGYDADDILRAQRYLDSLIDVTDLSGLVGAPVIRGNLQSQHLFPNWNPKDRSDDRVARDTLINLQLALAARWHRAEAPVEPVKLSALVEYSERPLELITTAVKEITMDMITRFAWNPPFTWGDLVLCRTALGSIARLLS